MSKASSNWYYYFRCVHAQVTQNNKFAVSLQYSKAQVSNEVDFSNADKHRSFPQTDTLILIGDDEAFPKFPK